MASPEPAELLQQAGRWAAELTERELIREPAAAQLREVLAQSYSERLDAPEDPLLVVMLCGPTAVGKSSLINALAGAAISRIGLGATTAAATIYVHERDDPARLFEYGRALGELAGTPASLVRHTRDELLHKVVVDTPDIDSAVRSHRETTAAQVHCADLVLFATSPEKYKVMDSAGWVARQRQQRAIAFVLNKWDRSALGPQWERRQLVEDDFCAVLGAQGFPDPLVFKISALIGPETSGKAIENDLPALAGWLAAGLDHAATAAIQQRRRRAGWGRLAAAIAAAVPAPISGNAFMARAADRLAGARVAAGELAAADTLSLSAPALEGCARPTLPGLLGGWLRFIGHLTTLAAVLRPRLTLRGASRVDDPAVRAFGADAAGCLARTAQDLADEAVIARLPVGPVATGWSDGARALADRLARLPAAIEGELASGARRLSLRRMAGMVVLYGVEALLAAALLLAVWRLAAGFIWGEYATGALLLNTLALVIVLLLLGQIAANLMFPPLQERFRRVVIGRVQSLIATQCETARRLLSEQLEATERLAVEGHQLLASIDRETQGLAGHAIGETTVNRLFGTAPEEPARRQPVFE